MFNKTMKLILLPAVAAVVVACGGGGTASNTSLSGLVALGAAMPYTTVKVVDANGTLRHNSLA